MVAVNYRRTNLLSPFEEYKEVGTNLRHYGNMRFAQLTLFVAISGGLLAAILPKILVCHFVKKSLLSFWFIVCSRIFVIEKSAIQWWNRYYDRAKALENILGMRQYSCIDRLGLLTQPTQCSSSIRLPGCVWFRSLGCHVCFYLLCLKHV